MYADRAKRSDRFDGQILVGRLDQPYAIVLTRTGEVHIPAVRLKWWDVAEDKEKEAIVDGRTVTVGSSSPAPAGAKGARKIHPASLFSDTSPVTPVWWLSLAFAACVLWLGYRIFGAWVRGRLEWMTDRRRAYRSML